MVTRLSQMGIGARRYAGFVAKVAAPEGGEWEMIPPWLKRRRIATNYI